LRDAVVPLPALVPVAVAPPVELALAALAALPVLVPLAAAAAAMAAVPAAAMAVVSAALAAAVAVAVEGVLGVADIAAQRTRWGLCVRVRLCAMRSMERPLPDHVLARRAELPRKPDPVTLTGERVILRPFDRDADVERLHLVSCGQALTLRGHSVAAYDPDELVWRWMSDGPFASAAALGDWLAAHAERTDVLSFTVHDRVIGSPVGIATFMANSPHDLKIELGNIWYGPIAQRTGASREATRLMCAHAFGLGYRRVEWKCNALNERSRRAALAYGFAYEGTQDAHMIVKGRNRDTAWYRMLDRDWHMRAP
jgi:RimJ/RimL family protein N-acetyltransferase